MFSIMTTSFQHNCLQINISNLSGLSAKIDKNSLIQVGLKYVYTSHKLAMDWKVKLNNFPFIGSSSAHFRILLLKVELLDRCLSLFLFVGFKVDPKDFLVFVIKFLLLQYHKCLLLISLFEHKYKHFYFRWRWTWSWGSRHGKCKRLF